MCRLHVNAQRWQKKSQKRFLLLASTIDEGEFCFGVSIAVNVFGFVKQSNGGAIEKTSFFAIGEIGRHNLACFLNISEVH